MDTLPLSIYDSHISKHPSVHDSYLFQFLSANLQTQLKRLPAKEYEKLEYRQQALHDEILAITKQKIDEFRRFGEYLLTLNPPDQPPSLSSSQESLNTRLNRGKSNSNNTNNESPSIKPLKSSLAKSSKSSDTESEGKKSPKRVAFALEDQISVMSDLDDEGDDDVDDKEERPTPPPPSAETPNILGGQVYMEPEDTEEEMHSLSISGLLPDRVAAYDEKENGDSNDRYNGNDNDNDNDNESEYMFEFDETMADAKQGSKQPEVTDESYSHINPALTNKLLSPELGSSLPKTNAFELAGSFRTRPTEKYLADDDEDFNTGYYAPATAPPTNATTTDLASSVPIDIAPPVPKLPDQPTTAHTHSKPWSVVQEDNKGSIHVEPNEGIMNTDYTDAFNVDVNPAKMSFRERMRWESETSGRS